MTGMDRVKSEPPAGIQRVLDAMSACAASMGVTGVALAVSFPASPGQTAETGFLETGGVPVYSALSGRITDDEMNYYGIASLKLSYVLAGRPDKPARTGEVPWQGAALVIRDGMALAAAYSGGAGEEDAAIVEAGMSALNGI